MICLLAKGASYHAVSLPEKGTMRETSQRNCGKPLRNERTHQLTAGDKVGTSDL